MITLGLAEGDRVVVSGQYNLRQNSKATVTLVGTLAERAKLLPNDKLLSATVGRQNWRLPSCGTDTAV
jgi:hypothetical protein